MRHRSTNLFKSVTVAFPKFFSSSNASQNKPALHFFTLRCAVFIHVFVVGYIIYHTTFYSSFFTKKVSLSTID